MKIVNIILTSQKGGAEQVFIDYLKAFKKLGHEVFSIIKSDAPYEAKVNKLSSKVRKTTNSLGFYDFIAVRNIKKFLEEFDANVVFAHTGRATKLTRDAIAKIKNKKIFLVSINHSMNVKRSIGADVVLSVNKEIFYKTIDAGQEENKSFIMHNATDLDDAIEVVAPLDFEKKSEIILGVMGRFDEIKAFHFAIEAIAKLNKISSEKKLNKEFLLKIAGSGPQESFLRKLVIELNLQNEVEFLSWVEDKKIFFSSIDIFCLTSMRETFGLVLLEAMKYRKPIISTNADGPKEILRDKVDAILVEINPLKSLPDRIVEASLEIVSDSNLANKMVQNSFLRLKKEFSFSSLEDRLKEIVGIVK